MTRRLRVVVLLVVVAMAFAIGATLVLGLIPPSLLGEVGIETRPPIVVGLLHSQTGPLAINEKSLIDAEVLALEEINARGGVAGRKVRWIVKDGRSDALTFANQARRLIDDEKASVLVGCWTSDSRKAVQAVVEERGSLLIFPANYEGMERSTHTIYSGGSANQTVVPGVRWCFDTLKARRFFVVGTEEVWSRSVAEIAKDSSRAAGAEVVGESFLPIAGSEFGPTIEAIRAARPDVVLNLLVGESNVAFLATYQRAGLTAEKLPLMSFGFAEDERKRFEAGAATGHYTSMSYFQTVDRSENRDFVRKFKTRFGEDRVTSDAIVAAYQGVILWAQAASEAGSVDSGVVLGHIDRQSLDAPEGIVTIDPESRVIWRPFHVGRARPDGLFDVVWSISKPIRPLSYVGTRTRLQWRSFLDDLHRHWGGRWSAPTAGPSPVAPATTTPPPPLPPPPSGEVSPQPSR